MGAGFHDRPGVRQPPARDFPGESARHDIDSFEVYADHGRLVRRQRPELGAARRVPESQRAVGVAADYEVVRREDRVGKEAGPSLICLEQRSRRPVPDAGRPIGARRQDPALSDPAGREHLAGVALEPRDDAKRSDIDDERWARGCQVAVSAARTTFWCAAWRDGTFET